MKKFLLASALCLAPLGAHAQTDWKVELPFDTVVSFLDNPPVPPFPNLPPDYLISIERLGLAVHYTYIIYPPNCVGGIISYQIDFLYVQSAHPDSIFYCGLRSKTPIITGGVCCSGYPMSDSGTLCPDAYERHYVGACYTCANEVDTRDTLYVRVDSIAPDPQPHLLFEPTLRTVRLHFDTVATVTRAQRDGARARKAACPATQRELSVDARGRVCRSAPGSGVMLTYRAGSAWMSVGTPRR